MQEKETPSHQDQQTYALKSLMEISEETQTRNMRFMNKNRNRKKQQVSTLLNHKHKQKYVVDSSPKHSKLPMILNKNNVDQNILLKKSSEKRNHCILIDKGLGPFNSVQLRRRKGSLRYIDTNHFVKLYSQSNQQQFELIKEWLTAKKQKCKFYHSHSKQKKQKVINHHLSIKHIL